MNSYDSERMSDMLNLEGHVCTGDPNNAQLFIFNTCSIREKADEKLFSDLGRIRPVKDRNNGIIVVTGCVSQLRSNDILKRAPWVDIILGPQDIQYVVEKIHLLRQNHKPIVSTTLNSEDKFDKLTGTFFQRGVSEFVTIQEGCDNFCTYCVVPFTRGREFSRSIDSVLNEVRHLIDSGVKEITLLGQNVNSYCGKYSDGRISNLAELLYLVADIKGLKRLRYVTSNPHDLTEDIARAHRDISVLAPFLHLPVQSGSNEILRRMNRKYSAEKYLELIDMLRSYKKDMAFSSDFIVGFPGETEDDFYKTMDIVRKVGYAQAYSFKYSPRPRTAAAMMPNQISEEDKSRRLAILQELLNEQQNEFNRECIGKTLTVLFTKDGLHNGQKVGRSEYNQAVSVNNTSINVGDMEKIDITSMASHSLIGEISE